MHAGQLATLEDVIDFYDAGGGSPMLGLQSELIVPLHLPAQDKADLLAFLETLTGASIPRVLIEEP